MRDCRYSLVWLLQIPSKGTAGAYKGKFLDISWVCNFRHLNKAWFLERFPLSIFEKKSEPSKNPNEAAIFLATVETAGELEAPQADNIWDRIFRRAHQWVFSSYVNNVLQE